MRYILDTNTCVYYLNGTYPSVRDRLLSHSPSMVAIPAMVKAELLYGAWKSQQADRNLERVHRFLQPYEILAFDGNASEIYGQIRANLETRGESIGPNDLVIASTALAYGTVLITRNTNEFRRIPNLALEDWVIP